MAAKGDAYDGDAIDIGSRLEPFVDDWLIERMSEGLSLKLHSPRMAETVLRFSDRPWEGPHGTWVTIVDDDGRYRMYYRGGFGEEDIPSRICYAESTDGINWERPDLGLVEFEGSTRNNIICEGTGELSVFKDANPACRPDQQYKALVTTGYNLPVVAWCSPDGLRWRLLQEEPVLSEFNGAAAAYDSHFPCWWDEAREQYVLFHRAWYRPIEGKVRSIATRTSKDFIHWTPLKLLDFGGVPFEDLYTSAATRYFRAPHIILAFPKRFVRDRKLVAEAPYDGVSDAVFMSSRDGVHFDRRFMEAFIRPGRDRLNWVSRTNMLGTGMIQTAPDEISIYISQHYSMPSCHLRRCVLRTDGFVSVNASYAGGELVTRPLIFDGRTLVINYATSAAGSVRVAITDERGRPLPSFEADNCLEMYGDEIEHVVQWHGNPSLAALAGRPARLRFLMKDADLFSLRFGQGYTSESPT